MAIDSVSEPCEANAPEGHACKGRHAGCFCDRVTQRKKHARDAKVFAWMMHQTCRVTPGAYPLFGAFHKEQKLIRLEDLHANSEISSRCRQSWATQPALDAQICTVSADSVQDNSVLPGWLLNDSVLLSPSDLRDRVTS